MQAGTGVGESDSLSRFSRGTRRTFGRGRLGRHIRPRSLSGRRLASRVRDGAISPLSCGLSSLHYRLEAVAEMKMYM